MKILFLLTSILFLQATAFAEGRCTPRDRNDHYAQMTCPSRSSGGEAYCEYNSDCVWTQTSSGRCGPRDRNDHYAQMTCPSRSSGGETYCEYNDDCVWFP